MCKTPSVTKEQYMYTAEIEMCVSDRRNSNFYSSCLPGRMGHEEKGERGLDCRAENHSFFVCYNLFQFICMCYYLGKINIKTTDTYSHRKKNQ